MGSTDRLDRRRAAKRWRHVENPARMRGWTRFIRFPRASGDLVGRQDSPGSAETMFAPSSIHRPRQFREKKTHRVVSRSPKLELAPEPAPDSQDKHPNNMSTSIMSPCSGPPVPASGRQALATFEWVSPGDFGERKTIGEIDERLKQPCERRLKEAVNKPK